VTQLRIDTWRRIIRTDLFHREKAASHAFIGVISEVFFFLSICSFLGHIYQEKIKQCSVRMELNQTIIQLHKDW
jgi:hypothetical protein